MFRPTTTAVVLVLMIALAALAALPECTSVRFAHPAMSSNFADGGLNQP